MIQLNIFLLPKKLKRNGWDKILTKEKKYLVSKNELKNGYYLFIDILDDGGYLIDGTTGYLCSNKENFY